MFTWDNDKGLTTQDAKCNFGVSCDKCEHFKFQAAAGMDFCQGVKIYADTSASVMSPPVHGSADVTKIMEKIIALDLEETWIPIPDRMRAAISFANQTMAFLASMSNSKKYTISAEYRYAFQFEVAVAGAGATFDMRSGIDMCESGWMCFGAEVAGVVTSKISGKMIMCVNTGNGTSSMNVESPIIKVEIGAGPLTIAFELGYMVEMGDIEERTDENTAGDNVKTETCLAEPSTMSQQQLKNDGWCADITDHRHCSHGCYWGKKTERPKYCFATPEWKLRYPDEKDGLCVWNSDQASCERSRVCIWATHPCHVIGGCKNEERLEHDHAVWWHHETCLAEPSWKSQQQDISDGLCIWNDKAGCDASSACYWGKRSERKKYCFAKKWWKDSHPGQKDGLCVWWPTEAGCSSSNVCQWAEMPCMTPYCDEPLDHLTSMARELFV